MRFDADGAAVIIHLKAIGALTDDNIRDVALIITYQPSGIREVFHAVGIGECLGMVHVEFIEAGGENVQIVNDLIDIGFEPELVTQDCTDDACL